MASQSISVFIRENIDAILVEWDSFAESILLTHHAERSSARDHAKGMLLAIAEDLDTQQTPAAQAEKSKGRAMRGAGYTQAELHGAARMLEGFSIAEAVSEFRALRASIMRLWNELNPSMSQAAGYELIRFNEAIDQALAESVGRVSAAKERSDRVFETYLSSTPDINCTLDLGGRIVYANKALADAYRKPVSQIVGRHFVELGASVSSDFQQHFQQQMDSVIKSKVTYRGDIVSHLRSGKEMTYEYFLVPVCNIEGKVEAIAVTARDMTERKRLENELLREKAISDTIIESAPGSFFMIDEHTNLVRWNSDLSRETGLSDEQLRGSSILLAIDERDRPLAAAKFMAAFAIGYASMEVRVSTGDHSVRYFLKTARRFTIDDVPYVAGFCVDVTDRKLTEQALEKEIAFSNALIEGVPGAFYVIDKEGNYFRWNNYLNKLTGLSDNQLKHQPALLTIHEADRGIAAATMKEAFENGSAQAELRVITKSNGVRPYLITTRHFQVGDSGYLVGIGTDVTEWHTKMQALEHEAWTDPLTRVVSRGHFMALAQHEFVRSRRYGHTLSLWMLDVDHFKIVNDTYGHHAGDVALQTLVSTSRQMLRDLDIMGRVGGEEFAVLLPETETHQAMQVAERLRQSVGATEIPLEDGCSAHITISIGIATVRDDDPNLEALFKRADQALYEAKRSGRDKVCVADDLTEVLAMPPHGQIAHEPRPASP